MVFGDLIEPMDLYYKHYMQTSHETFNQAKLQWSELEENKRKVVNAKDKYHKLMTEVE